MTTLCYEFATKKKNASPQIKLLGIVVAILLQTGEDALCEAKPTASKH